MMTEDTLVCVCMEVYKKEVANAIKNKGLNTIEEVAKAIGIGTACTECRTKINDILREITD